MSIKSRKTVKVPVAESTSSGFLVLSVTVMSAGVGESELVMMVTL